MWSSTWLCQKYGIASFSVMSKQAGHRHIQRRSGTDIPQNIADLSPCTHEDGDTRMIVHIGDDAKSSYKNVMIRTVDTDIVVLAVDALKFL